MTKEQMESVQDYLNKSGLTYVQLQSELLDHLVCDIEYKMEQGNKFEEAWEEVKTQVPKKEVKNIQNETMEVLQKRINLTKLTAAFAYFFAFAFVGFKLLHWTGADELILISLLVYDISLMMGYRLSAAHKGTGLLIIVILVIVAFLASILLRMTHYPLEVEVVNLGLALSLSILLPLISLYFYKAGSKGKDHGIIHFIGQNKTYIERRLRIFIGIGVLFAILHLLWLEGLGLTFMPTIFVYMIALTGLYQFSLTWIKYTAEPSEEGRTSKLYLLIFSSIAIILFLFSTVGELVSQEVKWASVTMSLVILSGIVITYYLKYSQDKQRYFMSIVGMLCVTYITINYVLRVGWLGTNVHDFVLGNISSSGVLIGLCFLFFFYKKPVFRMYMMLVLSYYMLSYIVIC